MSLLDEASLILTPNGYKEGKLYSIVPNSGVGDMTVTRATTATRVNSQGFIEVVPYNLALWSEQFDNILGWTKVNTSVIANTIISPSGTLTADKLINSSTNTFHTNSNNFNVISGNNYTASIFIKSGELNYALLALVNGFATTSIQVNLITGIVTTGTGTPLNITSNLINGFWRISFSGIATTTTIGAFSVYTSIDGLWSNRSYQGDGTSGFYIWGAQLVEGSTPKDYFPTTDRLNVPRIDYPIGGGCPSILVEPQRTNLITYSEDFNQVVWAKTLSAAISGNTTISPDGTSTADTFTAGENGSQIQGVIVGVSGTTYNISFFIKRRTGSGVVNIRAVENTNTPITITNNWTRITLSATSTSSTVRIGLNLSTSGDEVDIWGAQLEVGAYPTSYIPTVASTVTRNADVLSRNNIYTNGLITSAGGTWFVELVNNISCIRDSSGSGLGLNTSPSTTTGNGFTFRNSISTTAARLAILKVIADVNTPIYTTTTDTTKIAIRWNGTTADIFANGIKVISATDFTITNMDFIYGSGNNRTFNINQMWLENIPMPDAQLIAATTL